MNSKTETKVSFEGIGKFSGTPFAIADELLNAQTSLALCKMAIAKTWLAIHTSQSSKLQRESFV